MGRCPPDWTPAWPEREGAGIYQEDLLRNFHRQPELLRWKQRFNCLRLCHHEQPPPAGGQAYSPTCASNDEDLSDVLRDFKKSPPRRLSESSMKVKLKPCVLWWNTRTHQHTQSSKSVLETPEYSWCYHGCPNWIWSHAGTVRETCYHSYHWWSIPFIRSRKRHKKNGWCNAIREDRFENLIFF